MLVAEQSHAVGQVETPSDGDGIVAHVLLVESCDGHHLHVFRQGLRGHLVVLQQIVHEIGLAIAARPALHGIGKGFLLNIIIVIVVLCDADDALAVGIAHQRRAPEGQFLVLDVTGLHLRVLADDQGKRTGRIVLLHAVHIPLQVVADTHGSKESKNAAARHHIIESQAFAPVPHLHIGPPLGLASLCDMDDVVTRDEIEPFKHLLAQYAGLESGVLPALRFRETGAMHLGGVHILYGACTVQTLQGTSRINLLLGSSGRHRHITEHGRLQVPARRIPKTVIQLAGLNLADSRAYPQAHLPVHHLDVGYLVNLGTCQRRNIDVVDGERHAECKALAHQLQALQGHVAHRPVGSL